MNKYNYDEQAVEKLLTDSDLEVLERAMQGFCSLVNIREGMKHSIRLALYDQVEEQNEEDMKKLLNVLKDKHE